MHTIKPDTAAAPALPYEQALRLLEQARQDPRKADSLLALQRWLIDELADIARNARLALPRPASGKGSAMQARPVTASTLQAQGRNRQAAAMQHNELIEDLLAGALLNQHNPDWDPLDPVSGRENRESLLLAMLNMRIGGDAGEPASADPVLGVR